MEKGVQLKHGTNVCYMDCLDFIPVRLTCVIQNSLCLGIQTVCDHHRLDPGCAVYTGCVCFPDGWLLTTLCHCDLLRCPIYLPWARRQSKLEYRLLLG